MTIPPSENPYQSPAMPADDGEMVGEIAVKDRLLLRKCQQQMVVLGVLWVMTGLLGLGISAIVLIADTASEPQDFLFYAQVGVAFATSIVHLIVGVLTYFKQRSAVYLGLIMGYPTAFVNLLLLNLCPFSLLGIGLLLAHRVVRWAKELKARGIPLSASAELPP